MVLPSAAEIDSVTDRKMRHVKTEVRLECPEVQERIRRCHDKAEEESRSKRCGGQPCPWPPDRRSGTDEPVQLCGPKRGEDRCGTVLRRRGKSANEPRRCKPPNRAGLRFSRSGRRVHVDRAQEKRQ